METEVEKIFTVNFGLKSCFELLFSSAIGTVTWFKGKSIIIFVQYSQI